MGRRPKPRSTTSLRTPSPRPLPCAFAAPGLLSLRGIVVHGPGTPLKPIYCQDSQR